jgi:putative phage-type endonuclease
MEQRTDEWLEARRGKFTASQFSKLIGSTITATAHTYVLDKIVETYYGIKENIVSEAMQWGIDYEPEAIDYYSLFTGEEVESVGFVSSDDIIGGSPDGLVLDDGVIEIKCPFNPVNHLRYGLCKTAKDLKKLNKANYWQCIGNMMVTDSSWCDFISYDPRMDGEGRMYILRIEQNQDAVNELKQAIDRAHHHRMALILDLKLK